MMEICYSTRENKQWAFGKINTTGKLSFSQFSRFCAWHIWQIHKTKNYWISSFSFFVPLKNVFHSCFLESLTQSYLQSFMKTFRSESKIKETQRESGSYEAFLVSPFGLLKRKNKFFQHCSVRELSSYSLERFLVRILCALAVSSWLMFIVF